MPLRDPVAVYDAADNLEAHLVLNALEESGIEAMVVEDTSAVGWSWLGPLSGIHKPQVWVERESVQRAEAVIEQYEQNSARRRNELATGEPVMVFCEECGKGASYPATQRGSVQDCPHCGAYVDVEDVTDGDWSFDGHASEADG